MISIQKISKVVILALVFAGFVSCESDDAEPFTVKGDAYLITRLENDDLIFAMAYYAYGSQAMSMAKVTSPESEEIMLQAISDVQNIYAVEPTLSDFSSDIGIEGDYTFEVSNEGIAHQVIDEVNFDIVDIPVIDTTYYNTFSQVLSVEWEPDGSFNQYMVKMTELDGELVFASRLLGGSVMKYEIDENLGSWFKYVESGKEYLVELHGILYEPDATNDDFLYNVQEISIGTQEAVWGE